MKQDLQAYIDKIPQIVYDALPKLEKLGYNIWDINEDTLNMSELCDCILGQLEGQNGSTSSRRSIINYYRIWKHEIPDVESFFGSIYMLEYVYGTEVLI